MAREAQREKLEAEPGADEGGHDRLHSTAAWLSDADLLRRVVVLAAAEREATVELVAHLAELDGRKLYLGEGYGSLFGYCTGALRLAEHVAFNRIQAARASREFPAILDLLADGSLNLSTVRLIAPHLRADNFEAVVAMAKGRSKREVEVLVAWLAPRPDVASSVRKLPAPASTLAPLTVLAAAAPLPAATLPGNAHGSSEGAEAADAPVASVSIPPAIERPAPSAGPPSGVNAAGAGRHRSEIAPLAPGRYRVQFTVDEETHDKLRRAQDLLRREIPDGDPGAIFDRALTLLLEDVARKKLAETSKPRPVGAALTRSRHIPAHVRRAVWLRDGGQCAFVASSGRRCTERAFLQFHHHEPYAIGGEATVANISLRCHRHNIYEAERAFGPSVVSAVRAARAGRGHSPRGESGTVFVDRSGNATW